MPLVKAVEIATSATAGEASVAVKSEETTAAGKLGLCVYVSMCCLLFSSLTWIIMQNMHYVKCDQLFFHYVQLCI